MLHKIREVFSDENDLHDDNQGNDGKLANNVEIDESFIGGKNKNRHRDKKVEKCQGRSFKDKVPVFGMLERGKRVIAKVVSDTTVKTLQPLIFHYVRAGCNLYSDEWNYGKDTDMFYYHRHVDHGKGFYGKGDLTSNSIESFWALVKEVSWVFIIIGRRNTCRNTLMNVFLDLIPESIRINKDLIYFCKT